MFFGEIFVQVAEIQIKEVVSESSTPAAAVTAAPPCMLAIKHNNSPVVKIDNVVVEELPLVKPGFVCRSGLSGLIER